MSALNKRISALTAKTADLVVKEVTLPENSASPLALFESNSAARSDSANEWIVDVFPNMIPIFMFVLNLSGTMSGLIDHQRHAKSSVATVALYNMCLIYGFFLLNDLHVRPTPSAHASTWSQIHWKHAFAEFLLTLPVPEEIVLLLSQLHATNTDRTKNVFFIPSAAGFSHDHFFGRFVPLNFLSAIHDCTATMPGNSARIAILQDLLPRPLYTAGTYTSYFADILGITINNTTHNASYVPTKLHQMFNSIFNPVLFRDFHRRSSLATLDIQAPTSVNAYDILFSATSHNLAEFKVVLQAVSTQLTGKVTMKQNLRQVITSASGISILQHGYSTFALPTWTSHGTATQEYYRNMTTYTSVTATERSTAISFLSPPDNKPAANTAIVSTEYHDDAHTQQPLPNQRHMHPIWPFNLIRNTADNNAYPLITDLVKFEEPENVTPTVLVLDVSSSSTVNAHLATLTGKIIETFELDGTTIELPRHDKSLGMQNSMFADSAIPYRYTIKATEFHVRNAHSLPSPSKRIKPDSTRALPASSLIYDRLSMRIPYVNNQIVDAASPANLPGLTIQSTNWIYHTLSFIGIKTAHPTRHAANDDAPAHVPESRLLVWSPYTYTGYENNDEYTPVLADQRSYFLTNLRSLFGTDTNLVELKHPFEAMPVL